MRKFEELTIGEKKEITLLFANWLHSYTHEVVVRVLEKREDILNNEFAMNLLKELKERDEKELNDFNNSIGSLFMDFDDYKGYDVHSHPITHAKSYRDVLYDMYIK